MEFCDKCGSRAKIDPKKSSIVCQKCGYEKAVDMDKYRSETPLNISKNSNENGIVVLDKNYLDSKYKVGHKCPHCGNEEAYVRHIPPRWGDEDQLTIYTCTKCGKSDREGFSY